MKNTRKDIIEAIRGGIILLIKGNLGISGDEWTMDTYGRNCESIGTWPAICFDLLIVELIILTIFANTLTLFGWCYGSIIPAVCIVLWVGFFAPSLANSFKISYPVKGLTEEEALETYGREMKIVKDFDF
jgi:hypothetical protein